VTGTVEKLEDVGSTAGLPRPWLVLGLLCSSQLMIILDGSIVAVALPVIGADWRVTGPQLAWVVNAYLVPFGGLLLFAGRLGDLVGPRRVLLAGLVVFTAASAACALAPGFGILIAARFTQGIGGACASAVVLAMIVRLFREPAERARGLAVFGFVGAAGSSIGLLAGGLVTQHLGWAWIFWINVPIGLTACAAVATMVPALPGVGGRIDVLGAVLATTGLTLAVWALLTPVTTGTGALLLTVLALLALGLLGAFLVREGRTDVPLLPLRLLANRSSGLGNLVQALMVAGLFGFQFLGVLYLQQVLGYRPMSAGLAFLPVPVVIAAVSLGLTARLNAKFGKPPVLTTGLGSVTAGLGTLVGLPATDHYLTHFLPAGLLIGVGFGLAFPTLADLAVASAPSEYAGVASGLFNTTQQVGGAIGLATLTRLATATSTQQVAALSGYHLAFAAAAGLAGVAIVLGLRTTTDSSTMTGIDGDRDDA
jgi:EmrB/QacA subfamily drug resistance transporter